MPSQSLEVLYLVDDLDHAIRFWGEALNSRVKQRHDWGFALLEFAPDVDLALMEKSCFGSDFLAPGDQRGARISLRVKDLDVEIQRLRELGAQLGQISGAAGECRAVNAYDSDGNALFLWEEPESVPDEM